MYVEKIIIIIILIIFVLITSYYNYNYLLLTDQIYLGKIYPKKSECFFDYKIHYPELNIINQNRNIILEEFNKFKNSDLWYSYINDQLSLLPLFVHGRWSKLLQYFPKTYDIMKNIKKMNNISFSLLKKKSQMLPHQDWGVVSNNILRCHYGLIVPEKCGSIVENWVYFHKNDDWIVQDISKTHTSFNESEEDRFIIIVDMERPENIKPGKCTVMYDNTIIEFLKKYFNENDIIEIKNKINI